MTIIADKNTRIVIQGMTGKEGQRATDWMTGYFDTNISCGVTPGKGGQEVQGYPVFNSVKEAVLHDPTINFSVIYVPPLMVLDAAMEAMNAGIATVLVFTENVPIKDAAILVETAKRKNIRLIGPASIGIISPGKIKIGSMAGPETQKSFTPGRIGVISKSGSMSGETARLLTNAGYGQSTVVGVGGDVIAGTTFADVLEMFENDADTDAVVIYGEMGGLYEELAAEAVASGKITKPVVAYISGTFAEMGPAGIAMGHSGAIVEGGMGLTGDKKRVMKEAGIHVADYHHDIIDLLKKVLS